MESGGDRDTIPLVGDAGSSRSWWRKHNILCGLLVALGVVGFLIALGIGFYKSSYHEPINLRLISLNCWGVPHSMGSEDKEARMQEIGKMIAKKEHDVYLLEELWMRPDHATIENIVNSTEGLYMTKIYELGPYGTCDGRVAPTGCSGLAIVSTFPFVEVEFKVFSVHGDILWFDGEYEARKGVGRVRIEPRENITVDIFVTHTAASDYNFYYRQIQVGEIINHVKSSSADFAILGGDFNVDPRMNETSYKDLTDHLHSSMFDFFKFLKEMLEPSRATYANPANTYSNTYKDGPQLYDHFFHLSQENNSIITNIFHIPFLKATLFDAIDANATTKGANVRSEPRTVSFSDHEAITADLVLFKSKNN